MLDVKTLTRMFEESAKMATELSKGYDEFYSLYGDDKIGSVRKEIECHLLSAAFEHARVLSEYLNLLQAIEKGLYM